MNIVFPDHWVSGGPEASTVPETKPAPNTEPTPAIPTPEEPVEQPILPVVPDPGSNPGTAPNLPSVCPTFVPCEPGVGSLSDESF